MEHTDIRKATIDALESYIGKDALYFDGRPTVLEEGDFSAVTVLPTDAGYIGEELDTDIWQVALHTEIFLPVQVPDPELDDWMEPRIYPVLGNMPGLSPLINDMAQQGYDYQRDDDLGLWGSTDLKYFITYEMQGRNDYTKPTGAGRECHYHALDLFRTG